MKQKTRDEIVNDFRAAHARGEATATSAIAIVQSYVDAEETLPPGLVYGLIMALPAKETGAFQTACAKLLKDIDTPGSDFF